MKDTYLGLSPTELKEVGGAHTAKEIQQQPQLWLDTFDAIAKQKAPICAFLKGVYARKNLKIILTGAGTSAFIGNILQGPFNKHTGKSTWAIATTDLVSHPHLYFEKETPTLLISFARSGNSPESIAAVNLANNLCENVFHLIITCNADGTLASHIHGKGQSFTFLLPPEADDQSLAMTGSFTSMLLTGLLISRIQKLKDLKEQVNRLATYGSNVLKNYTGKLQNIARKDFDRAVFLGSGPLNGTARESQLKLQELTDGKVICKYDSFLGFRHGPKAVINPSTLLVYLFSNNDYAHQYEMDLVKTINGGSKGLAQIGIFESDKQGLSLEMEIIMSKDGGKIDEEFLSVGFVLPSQILSFFKSLHLGLKPDSPSVDKSITRVVQGVNIYPFPSPNGNVIKENIDCPDEKI